MNLSKLLPRFHKSPDPKAKKERVPRRAEAQPLVVIQPKPLDPPPQPVEMLDSITRFLRRHLTCEDYQYTLLALGIVHTWCAQHFPATPYLHVRSAEPQSAKTLCLQLLSALCHSPWIATGAHSRSIMDNLLTSDRRVQPGQPLASAPPPTILLDDCHHTFAPSERQPLLALLNSGSHAGCNYLDGLSRYSVFGPKVFAGNSPLPRSLASRCIPIALRRKKPLDEVARFNPQAAITAAGLARSLQSWAAANSAALARLGHQTPPRVPAGLSARQQDCAEPLLHIADLIGAAWPERVRAAIVAAFKLADDSLALELLADIRAIFYIKEDPSYLSSHDLLAALSTLDHRPWAAWCTRSGRRLASLLHPVGVTSRSLHKGCAPSFKGYLRDAFLDPWERYLPPVPADWPEVRAKMKKEGQLASAQQ